ncbi:MAG: hypothetical protein P4L51_15800 [Puia sp.]|nr:hypothetical protein [Puia sp.]
MDCYLSPDERRKPAEVGETARLNQPAGHGAFLINQVSEGLSKEFGRGFSVAKEFPCEGKSETRSRSGFINMVALAGQYPNLSFQAKTKGVLA